MADTYYDLLGVAPDATCEEIERAYREKLKETHPDVSDDEDAGARTRRLIEAKEVLTDEHERARYDRLGHEQYVNTEATAGGPDVSPGPTAERTGGSTSGTDSSERKDTDGPWTGSDRTSGQESSHEQRAARDSWRDSSDSGAVGGSSRNWRPNESYAVRGEAEGLLTSRLFPVGQSLVLLAATFLLYPVLLAGALAPPFPLTVNAVLALCLLGVVAYLQSIPEVGIVVFGVWSLLLPALLWGAAGVSPVSVVGGIAVAATVLPLGLSCLTRAVIRA